MNEDTQRGGVEPQAEYDHWMPPVQAAGYHSPRRPRLYRWQNGEITKTDANYTEMRSMLVEYRTSALFYCDRFLHFRASLCDPTIRDMITAPQPFHRWYRLTFENDRGTSRVDVAASEEYLPNRRPSWISKLGLDSYCDESCETPELECLAGNLAIIIGLIAFSCRPGDLGKVLAEERA